MTLGAPGVRTQPPEPAPHLPGRSVPSWPKQPAPEQAPAIARKDAVAVCPGLTLARHWPQPPAANAAAAAASGQDTCTTAASQLHQAAASEELLAGLLAHSHVLRIMLANAQVLQLAAGPGALAAATAVRMGAKRVLVTHPERTCLACLASSLHENRSKASRVGSASSKGGDPCMSSLPRRGGRYARAWKAQDHISLNWNLDNDLGGPMCCQPLEVLNSILNSKWGMRFDLGRPTLCPHPSLRAGRH